MEYKNYYSEICAIEQRCYNDIFKMVANAGYTIEFTTETSVLIDYYGDIRNVIVKGVYIDDDILYVIGDSGKDYEVADIIDNDIITIYNRVFNYTHNKII